MWYRFVDSFQAGSGWKCSSILIQNKFEKLVHLVGFIIKKFVTMHGHMNIKYFTLFYFIWNCLFVWIYRRLGETQGSSWRMWKISPLPRFDPWTVQSTVNHYTDYSVPAHPMHLTPQVFKLSNTFRYACIHFFSLCLMKLSEEFLQQCWKCTAEYFVSALMCFGYSCTHSLSDNPQG
jgi:hypothetical protein